MLRAGTDGEHQLPRLGAGAGSTFCRAGRLVSWPFCCCMFWLACCVAECHCLCRSEDHLAMVCHMAMGQNAIGFDPQPCIVISPSTGAADQLRHRKAEHVLVLCCLSPIFLPAKKSRAATKADPKGLGLELTRDGFPLPTLGSSEPGLRDICSESEVDCPASCRCGRFACCPLCLPLVGFVLGLFCAWPPFQVLQFGSDLFCVPLVPAMNQEA